MWKILKIISKGDYYYALVPNHPNSTINGYVLYHRIVVENSLGRLLDLDEIVHHKDHNKKNNNIENLEVMNSSAHAKEHAFERFKHLPKRFVELICPSCKKVFVKGVNSCHVGKKNSDITCCSRTCSGKFHSTHMMLSKRNELIEQNVNRVFALIKL